MRADLALIGFGHVARRFVRLLAERRDRLDHEGEVRIVAIATRRHGTLSDPAGLDAAGAAGVVESGGLLASLQSPGSAPPGSAFEAIGALSRSDAPIRVMVETTTLDIAAGRPAIDHVEAALDAGCHVVTANKGPAAFAYARLTARAGRSGRRFLFEGAVMDGVPVFNLVRETLPLVDVLGIRGVLNSTTTHILSAMERGESFDSALRRMQAQGIAEADPSFDIDGWDAAAKIAALANVLMNAGITPHDVRRTGIDESTGRQAAKAVARGSRIRLVASCRRGETPVVAPSELPAGDLLARLEGTGNALVLSTDLLGDVVIAQPAGDLTATAYALLSDLIAVVRKEKGSEGSRFEAF